MKEPTFLPVVTKNPTASVRLRVEAVEPKQGSAVIITPAKFRYSSDVCLGAAAQTFSNYFDIAAALVQKVTSFL